METLKRNGREDCRLMPFAEELIADLQHFGKFRTSETYAASLKSFMQYRQGIDVYLEDIDSCMMMSYEAFLRRKGVSQNTSSFYMRNLRAIYNRAVQNGLAMQSFPFKHVYTGICKTVKRAIPLKVIRQIKDLDLHDSPMLEFARDMFMFSFYTRGMSFIDMAYLRKRDLNGRQLTYRRRKTGQTLIIRWEGCMQEIVCKYACPDSGFMFPIIKSDIDTDDREQYIRMSQQVNRSLKTIGRRLGVEIPLTMYVSRHAWASIAKCNNVPLSVISDSLGHDSEMTTRIYLASFDTSAVDKANRMILDAL